MAILDNIVAAYSFDNTPGNLVDATGNGNTLTNNGSTTFTTGLIGQAPVFDGSDAHKLNIASNLSSGGAAYTVAFWVKINNYSPGGYLVDIGATSATAYRTLFYTGANNVVFHCTGNEISTGAISTGVWTFIVGTRSGNDWELFMNTASQGTTTTGTNFSGTNEFVVGNTIGGGFSVEPVANIDIAGVWTRVLTSDEISLLYNGGAGIQYPFAPATFNAYPMMHHMQIAGGLM